MKLLTENRGDYVEALRQIEPQLVIAPFGFHISGFEQQPLRIITKPESKFPKATCWQIYTNKNVHAKIVIGNNGILIGSWNFTNTSTQNAHECAVVILNKDNPELVEECKKYFEKMWNRIKEVQNEKACFT